MNNKLVRMILMGFACSTVPSMCRSTEKINVRTMTDDNIYDMNQMSINLLNIIVNNERQRFAYSPFGFGELITVAAMYSLNKTQKEFLRIIQVRDQEPSITYTLIDNYYKQYNNDKKYFQMKSNNAIIAKIDPYDPYDFEDSNIAKIISLEEFNEYENAKKINAWLREISNNRTDKLTDSRVYSRSKLIFLNVMYISGTWSIPFDPQLTRKKPFILFNTQKIYHPTMHRKGHFNYSELTDINIKAKIVQIPFKVISGKQVFMFVILPFGTGKFSDIERNIRRITVGRLFNCTLEKINLYLPRFNFEVTNDLTEILTEMNIHEAFTEHAMFNIHQNNPGPLTYAYQKVYFNVHENGSSDEVQTEVQDEHDSTYEVDENYKEFFVKEEFLVVVANEDFMFLTARVGFPSLY